MCALSCRHHETQTRSMTQQPAGSPKHGDDQVSWSSFQLNEGDEASAYGEDARILLNKNKFKSIYVRKCRGLVEPHVVCYTLCGFKRRILLDPSHSGQSSFPLCASYMIKFIYLCSSVADMKNPVLLNSCIQLFGNPNIFGQLTKVEPQFLW